MITKIDAVAVLREALKNLINLDQRSGWHSKEQDAAIAALDATERAAIQPAGEAVLFFKQKCSKIWIETDRINWLDNDPKLADLFDVRTLYAAPISKATAQQEAKAEPVDAEMYGLDPLTDADRSVLFRQSAPSGSIGECGACHGSGWVVRDADIGTDQECFSCGGSGLNDDPAPSSAARTPAIVGSIADDAEFCRHAENWATQSRHVYAPESWERLTAYITHWAEARATKMEAAPTGASK